MIQLSSILVAPVSRRLSRARFALAVAGKNIALNRFTVWRCRHGGRDARRTAAETAALHGLDF